MHPSQLDVYWSYELCVDQHVRQYHEDAVRCAMRATLAFVLFTKIAFVRLLPSCLAERWYLLRLHPGNECQG